MGSRFFISVRYSFFKLIPAEQSLSRNGGWPPRGVRFGGTVSAPDLARKGPLSTTHPRGWEAPAPFLSGAGASSPRELPRGRFDRPGIKPPAAGAGGNLSRGGKRSFRALRHFDHRHVSDQSETASRDWLRGNRVLPPKSPLMPSWGCLQPANPRQHGPRIIGIRRTRHHRTTRRQCPPAR